MSIQKSLGPLPLLPITLIASILYFVRKTSARTNPKPLHPSVLPMKPKPLAAATLLPELLRSASDLNLFLSFFTLGYLSKFWLGEGKSDLL